MKRLELLTDRRRSWYDVPIYDWDEKPYSEDEVQHWSNVLKDERVIAQLQRRVPSFEPQSPAGAKRYETLTAAINIAPATDKHYDITQIKSDAEWLSKDLHINEIQALRVVLLEWQNRPHLHLQAGYSDAEIASLRDIYGAQLAFDADFEASTLCPRNEDEFKTVTDRRRRQLFIHGQEAIGYTRVWLAFREKSIAQRLQFPDALQADVEECMVLLCQQINLYAEGLDWQVIDEESYSIWQTGTIYYVQYLMQAVIYLAHNIKIYSTNLVEAWLKIMGDSQFLQTIGPSALLPPDQLDQIRSLVSITTIAVIDTAGTFDLLHVDPVAHWIYKNKAALAVQANSLLFVAVDEACMQAVPAAFAWALVLRRIYSRASEDQVHRDLPGAVEVNPYQEIYDAIAAQSTHPNPIAFLLDHTINTYGVADILVVLAKAHAEDLLPIVRKAKLHFIQEVIAAANSELPDAEGYGPTVLDPQFAVLDPPRSMLTWGLEYVESCKVFLAYEPLREGLLDVATARFPYEALPFLRLCRQLALASVFQEGTQYITYRLNEMVTFTQTAIGPFEAYHTIREDENLNLVSLDQNTYAFPRNNYAAITQGSDRSESLIIPAETTGEVISNSDPPVIRWAIKYSGLRLIGEWLELHSKGQLHEILNPTESVHEVVAELILLLANLLASTFRSSHDGRDAAVDFIFKEVSEPLQFGASIITLVFDIIEQELQSYRSRPSNLFDTGILTSALEFVRALLLTRPSQFWQHISKCSIINPHGSSSLLWTVVSGVEALAASAPLAESSALLYDDMIIAALRRGVDSSTEKQWRSTTSNNFMNAREHVYGVVMTSMTQNMVQLFESMGQWKEKLRPQEPKIITNLCNSFSTLLKHHYGTGSQLSQLTSCFEGAASLILSRLRPESIGDARVSAILFHLLDAADLTKSFSPRSANRSCHNALFELANVLIEAAISLEETAVGLELCLFDLLPVIIRKTGHLPFSPQPGMNLLRTLLHTVPAQKPASLLGHLGSSSAIDFIDLLTLAQTSPDLKVASDAWKLLSLLVNKDQQWLSVVLLTGSIPGRTGNQASAQQYVYRGRLVPDIATDMLLKIKSIGDKVSLVKPAIGFMITAQQTWSWTSNSVDSRQELFTALIQYACATSSPTVEQRNIIALITDFASGYLHYARSIQATGLIKIFSPLIDWLTRNAIEVNSYNQSLQAKFSSNFTEKFRLDLNDFRINHSMFKDAEEVFDMQLADIVLGGTGAWMPARVASWKASTYRDEMARANENLAVVNADLRLLYSFQKLCIEHSVLFCRDGSMHKTISDIVQRCLLANARKHPAEKVFDNLLQTRADVALTLTQSLVRNSERLQEGRNLLKPAWDATLFCNANYEEAILNDDLKYWRSCLTILMLSMQFHVGSNWKPLSKNPTSGELLKHTTSGVSEVIQIATTVVGQGLATIVSILQEQKQAAMQQQKQTDPVDIGIKDIGLVLNSLETLLRLERLPEFAGQLSERLVATDAIQSSMRLYSWAHLLASTATDNNPIHAELGIRLLVSLSSLSVVAEEMAVEGVLNTTLTARVTQVLQKIPEGVSNLDQRAHCMMLYTIWSEGILPLSLNLLHAVGAPLASEISLFLNTFPEQLKRAGVSLQPREGAFITLGLAKEISTLSIISYILEDYKNAGASAAVDPSSIHVLAGFDEHRKAMMADLKEHVDLDKAALKSKIVPTTEKELGWHGKDVLASKVLKEMQMAHACLTSMEDLGASTTEANRPAGNRAFAD